jgi:hypothetical protein
MTKRFRIGLIRAIPPEPVKEEVAEVAVVALVFSSIF